MLFRSRGEGELERAYLGTLLAEEEQLKECLRQGRAGDWDACRQAVLGVSFGRLSPLSAKKYPDEERKKQVRGLRDEVKELVREKLQRDCFLMDSAQYRQDMEYQQPILRKLFQLTDSFDQRLRDAKLDRSLLDFGDLEHYALELLYQTDGEGRHLPSPVARETAARYYEILVDEYQDTNAAQEMIFQAVSRGGENLFMVGEDRKSVV